MSVLKTPRSCDTFTHETSDVGFPIKFCSCVTKASCSINMLAGTNKHLRCVLQEDFLEADAFESIQKCTLHMCIP